MALSPGFGSAITTATGKPRLFLLFTHRKRVHAVLFDQNGGIHYDSEQRDRIMKVIRSTHQTPLSEHLPSDDDYDAWIERRCQTWCAQHEVLKDELHIICALALMS